MSWFWKQPSLSEQATAIKLAIKKRIHQKLLGKMSFFDKLS
jgi:hypothetical protein